MAATPGLKFLESKGVAVTLHPYDYDPDAEAVGLAAGTAVASPVGGRAVGLPPGRVGPAAPAGFSLKAWYSRCY